MPDRLPKAEFISILNTHPDIIYRYDTDLIISYANEAAAAYFGLSRGEVIGRSMLDLAPPEHHDAIRLSLAKITLETPKTIAIQRVDHPDDPKYILWHGIGLFEDDTLVGYQSIGRNVSKETQLKQALKARTQELNIVQKELRAVLDAVPATIWYKDDKNNILRLNKAAADSIGMTVEDVEGRNTYDLFGPSAKKYHDDDLKVFNSGKAMRGIIEPFTPDTGRQGWVQTDKLLIEAGDGEMRLLAVATDITELKEKEAILKSINKNLDDFASMVSHDLQAPLRKIGITAELMQLEIGDTLPDGTTPYFEDIAAGVDRMRSLIRNFLRFMRGSPNSVALEPVDLVGVLRAVSEDFKEPLQAAGGTLHLPTDPIYIRGDSQLLHQVFANLVGNSIKYRNPDRAVRINIEAHADQQFWAIQITDNGSGIDPAHTDSIFDLFDRAKPHSTIEGSGVGLALCQRIIALHGGDIRLTETGTDGSTFEVKLFRSGVPDGG